MNGTSQRYTLQKELGHISLAGFLEAAPFTSFKCIAGVCVKSHVSNLLHEVQYIDLELTDGLLLVN